jgi:hypothetical protein
MTEKTATLIANVVLGAAAIGAAYAVITTPRLRRFAVGLAITGLSSTLPVWFGRELQQAWMDSGTHGRSRHAAI